MAKDLSPALEGARIADIAREYFGVRNDANTLAGRKAHLATILKEWCLKTGEIIEVEGQPPLGVREYTTAMKWDGHAIDKLVREQPFLWQRLCELGAVQLNVGVIREALKNGQLGMMPPGGHEGREYRLEFEKGTGNR